MGMPTGFFASLLLVQCVGMVYLFALKETKDQPLS